MPERYWLVHPNGGRQLIDPYQLDLDRLAEHARQIGGRLVVEPVGTFTATPPVPAPAPVPASGSVSVPNVSATAPAPRRFEPPISAVGPLFRLRLNRVYSCLC